MAHFEETHLQLRDGNRVVIDMVLGTESELRKNSFELGAGSYGTVWKLEEPMVTELMSKLGCDKLHPNHVMKVHMAPRNYKMGSTRRQVTPDQIKELLMAGSTMHKHMPREIYIVLPEPKLGEPEMKYKNIATPLDVGLLDVGPGSFRPVVHIMEYMAIHQGCDAPEKPISTVWDVLQFSWSKGIRLTDKVKATFTCQLMRGLETLEGNGIIHRDLKPNNLLLDKKALPEGVKAHQLSTMQILEDFTRLLVADPGLAKMMTPKEQQSNAPDLTARVCTRIYGAPEIMFSGPSKPCAPVGCSSDIWSLGTTLFHIFFPDQQSPFKQWADSNGQLQHWCDSEDFEQVKNAGGFTFIPQLQLRSAQQQRVDSLVQLAQQLQEEGNEEQLGLLLAQCAAEPGLFMDCVVDWLTRLLSMPCLPGPQLPQSLPHTGLSNRRYLDIASAAQHLAVRMMLKLAAAPAPTAAELLAGRGTAGGIDWTKIVTWRGHNQMLDEQSPKLSLTSAQLDVLVERRECAQIACWAQGGQMLVEAWRLMFEEKLEDLRGLDQQLQQLQFSKEVLSQLEEELLQKLHTAKQLLADEPVCLQCLLDCLLQQLGQQRSSKGKLAQLKEKLLQRLHTAQQKLANEPGCLDRVLQQLQQQQLSTEEMSQLAVDLLQLKQKLLHSHLHDEPSCLKCLSRQQQQTSQAMRAAKQHEVQALIELEASETPAEVTSKQEALAAARDALLAAHKAACEASEQLRQQQHEGAHHSAGLDVIRYKHELTTILPLAAGMQQWESDLAGIEDSYDRFMDCHNEVLTYADRFTKVGEEVEQGQLDAFHDLLEAMAGFYQENLSAAAQIKGLGMRLQQQCEAIARGEGPLSCETVQMGLIGEGKAAPSVGEGGVGGGAGGEEVGGGQEQQQLLPMQLEQPVLGHTGPHGPALTNLATESAAAVQPSQPRFAPAGSWSAGADCADRAAKRARPTPSLQLPTQQVLLQQQLQRGLATFAGAVNFQWGADPGTAVTRARRHKRG